MIHFHMTTNVALVRDHNVCSTDYRRLQTTGKVTDFPLIRLTTEHVGDYLKNYVVNFGTNLGLNILTVYI